MSTTPFVKFKQDLGDNKFALNTAGYGMTESGLWLPIKVTDEGVQEVQLSGTIVVKTVGDLPPTGYMAQVALVSEGRRVFIYDGNEWGEW
jgi:hypothetical protein